MRLKFSAKLMTMPPVFVLFHHNEVFQPAAQKEDHEASQAGDDHQVDEEGQPPADRPRLVRSRLPPGKNPGELHPETFLSLLLSMRSWP